MSDFIRSRFITSPDGISFIDWVGDLHITLPNLRIPVPDSLNKWKEWVMNLISLNPQIKITVPYDLDFPKEEDWREWARYFMDDIKGS